jgi:hypothetical protein
MRLLMKNIDRFGEVAARWLASRTSRRSFLGVTGKTVLVVAGGTGLSQIFALRAEARLCGQSGISPKCPTFDCVGDDVAWGWCWYASPGCCSNGGLKKICDCCKRNHPNVQGYCPDGSAVYCVVESCLEDPRVQLVPVERYVGGDAIDVSLARSAQRNPGSAPVVVMANGLDPFLCAIAAPMANSLGAPMLLADPGGHRAGIREELARLGAKRIVIVGAGLESLRDLPGVERVADSRDLSQVSVAVLRWLDARSTISSVICIGSSLTAMRIAASVSAYASLRSAAVVVNVSSVRALSETANHPISLLLVGSDVSEFSVDGLANLSTVERIPGVDPSVISQMLGERLFVKDPAGTFRLVVVADSSTPTAAGTLPVGGLVIVHGDGAIDPALRDWLFAHRKRFTNVDLLVTLRGSLGDQGTYDLQSAVNGYEAHYLVGSDGQGLPVIAQPLDERELGKAKVSGKPIPPTTIASKANAKRKPPAPNPAPPVSTPPTAVPRTVPSVPTTTTMPNTSTTTVPVSTTVPASTTIPVFPSSTSTTTIPTGEPLPVATSIQPSTQPATQPAPISVREKG